MSKSLGNVIKIRDFVEKYGGQVLRQIYLSVHYRARLEWTDDVLHRAIEETKRIHEFAIEAKNYQDSGDYTSKEITECMDKMKDELSNDFNSAGAMGHFFSLLRNVKANKDKLSKESLNEVHVSLKFVQDALGLINTNPESVIFALQKLDKDTSDTGVDAAWIEVLIEERKTAKATKNWARADEIRKEVASKNIVLKDNPDGSTSWTVQN
jgi:cysteinyl-tRNA synthetase